jgi:PKD repeat protein
MFFMPARLRALTPARRLHGTRGQSIAEFVLMLPALLLIVVVAIDFGRIYLGYVNLQQMARIAGAFASLHATAWDTPGDTTIQGEYQQLVLNDATENNCTLPGPVPPPQFTAGFDLGDPITIEISCNFDVVTPIISSILGGTIPVSASTTYPVREGAVADVPGGGGPIQIAPIADFVGSPTTGYGSTVGSDYGPLSVIFTDLSRNAPTSWTWDFGDGKGLVAGQGPHTVQYACSGSPGDTCTFTVKMTATSAGGSDSVTRTNYVTVEVPPDTGPVAAFTATPRTGVTPPALSVQFTFRDVRAGTVTYSNYEWDFDYGVGPFTADASGASLTSVSHNYTTPGAYTVALRVTEAGTGLQDTDIRTGFIVVNKKICTVPDFANHRKNDAQGIWNTAGFTTTVGFLPGNGNYLIHSQAPTGGTIDPQPNGCDSMITVGP